MDFDRLKMFVAIVEEGSLTGAAKRLEITQPAVSRSLKLLEENLGVELFERVGRGLQITAGGRALLARAQEVLDQLERVEREVVRAAKYASFTLRLGATEDVAAHLLPGILAPLRGHFSEVVLQCSSMPHTELLQKVRDAELDVVIVAASEAPDARHVRGLGVSRTAYHGRRDLFPSLERITREEEISRTFPMITPASSPAHMTSRDDQVGSFARVSSLTTLKALVTSGFGVGALPDFMLSAIDHEILVRGPFVHDADRGLFLITGEHFVHAQEQELVAFLADALAGLISQSTAILP